MYIWNILKMFYNLYLWSKYDMYWKSNQEVSSLETSGKVESW